MKSQSLKLFAIACVLGLATIFASANSANAQTNLSFETPFDFNVGKDKLSAGKYELRKLNSGKYLLRNAETKVARLVVFDIAASNKASSKAERVIFNRYGKTYFLNGVFDKRGADGREISETNYEKQFRKGTLNREDKLADEKEKLTKVEVKLSK